MFDFSQAEDQKSNVLPKGNYHVSITNAEVTQSKAGKDMLKIEFTVQSGDYSGRKIWKTFMLQHNNANVVNIAKSQIKAMCLAAGKEPRFSSPSDLCGFEMEVTTKIKESEGYDPSADITYFKPLKANKSSIPF